MTTNSVSAPFPIFTDTDGDPLDLGYVYIGQPNQDAQSSPKSAYWDAALTIPAAQPIRTRGGYPVNNGTPARIYVDGDYSIKVNNRNGTLIYNAPTRTNRIDGGLISGVGSDVVTYTPAGTGAVATTVQEALREMAVSVKRFGAKGDGVTDDTASVQACWDYCRANNRTAFVPKGVYRIGQTNIGPGMSIIGEAGSTFKLLDNQPKFTRMLTTENNPWVVTSQTEDSPILYISGLTFDGNQTNQGAYTGYEKEQQQQLLLSGSGAVNTNNRKLRAVVKNCIFKNGCSDGVSVYRSVDVKVSNCFFWNMFRGSVVVTGANSVVEVDNISCGGDLWNSFIQSEIDGAVNGLSNGFMTVTNSFFDTLRDNSSAGTGADFGLGPGSKLTVSNCVFNAGLQNLFMGDSTSVANFSNCSFRQLTGSDNLVSPGIVSFSNCTFLNTTANTSGRLLSFRQFTTTNHRATFTGCIFDAEFDAQAALTSYSSGVTVTPVSNGVFDFDVGTAHGISAPGNYGFQMIIVSGMDQWQYNKAYWISSVPTATSFRVNVTEYAGAPTSAGGITVRVIADTTKMVNALYLNGAITATDKSSVTVQNCRFGQNIYSAVQTSNNIRFDLTDNLFECANLFISAGSSIYPQKIKLGQNSYAGIAGNLLAAQGNSSYQIDFTSAFVPARVAYCRFYLGISFVATELQSRMLLTSSYQPNNSQQRLFWQDWSYTGASAAGVPSRYSNNGASWFASGSTVAKGATASRPALSSIDQGQIYLDTTLNANGKLITWTGTAWVDATGALA